MTIINPYRFGAGGGGGSPLLDTVTGAEAAYSLRLLRSAYSGDAIRVRRSSDNTQQDIGFDGSGDLDTSALTSFVGAGDGFLATWYDQSGNGRNATQSTWADQPKIVESGTVSVDSSGNPRAVFSGSQDIGADFNPTTLSQPTYFTLVAERTSVATRTYIFDSFDGGARQALFVQTNEVMFAGSLPSIVLGDTDRHIWSLLYNGASSGAWQDGVDVSPGSTVGSNGLDGIRLGSRFNGSEPMSGYISEFVVWASDQSANRSTIEDDVATYYGITL